jgi:hypothetical protein
MMASIPPRRAPTARISASLGPSASIAHLLGVVRQERGPLSGPVSGATVRRNTRSIALRLPEIDFVDVGGAGHMLAGDPHSSSLVRNVRPVFTTSNYSPTGLPGHA